MSMQNSQPDTLTPEMTPATPWWRRLLQPPASLDDPGDQRQAQLLLGLSLTFFFTTTIGAIVGGSTLALALLAASAFVAVWFSRTRYFQLGSALIIAILTMVTLVRTAGDIESPIFFMPLTFVLATVLLSYRYAVAAIIINVAGLFFLPLFSTITYGDIGRYTGTLTVLGLLFVYTTFFRNSLERDRLKRLRETNESLEMLRTNLDKQVQARTAELALAADVGRSLSQVRDLEALLQDASELIQERFNLYHVQIYLTDDSQRSLILRGGSGHAAQELMRRKHSLKIGAGSINGTVAAEKRPIIVSDTARSPLFRPNPLLPETRSEMSVPLLSGDEVIGVLNVQSNEINALSEAGLPAFETLAGQMATAIENARLFAIGSQARLEMEAHMQQLTREGWHNYLDAINHKEALGYRFADNQLKPLSTLEYMELYDKHVIEAPIAVTDTPIGKLRLATDDSRAWSEDEKRIINAVAFQVGQRLENLRILAESAQYRDRAEEATRRLTRQNWQFAKAQHPVNGYLYDQNKVVPLDGATNTAVTPDLSQPLTIHGETIGNLELIGVSAEAGQRNQLIKTVAARLSDHLENLRLSAQTQRALAETETLFRISSQLNGAGNTEEIINTLVQELMHTTDDNIVASLFTVQAEDGRPQTLEMVGSNAKQIQARIGETFDLSTLPTTKSWASSGDPLLINDTATDPRLDELTRNIHQQIDICSSAILPLRLGAGWIGLLILSWTSRQMTFTAADERLFRSIAQQLSVVMNSQMLFDATQRRAEREEIVNTISQKIQRTTTIESALKTVVAELGKALNASNAKVELGLPKENQDAVAANGSNGATHT